MQNVHIRVSDADTKKPTPVRIRFVGSDGKYHAPFGRLTEFTGIGAEVGGNVMVDGKEYAYIDGACEIRLPVGPVQVEIHKGPEYVPVFETVNLTQGKLAMRFEIRRWIDMRAQGWYSGVMACINLTPHAALLEARAEDLAVVNLLATESSRTNILAFSGQKPCLEVPGHMVTVNTLNTYGFTSLALLNSHRPVYPLSFNLSDQDDSWNLADWCEQCHRKKGLVVAIPFPLFTPEGSEELSNVILNQIDAVGILASYVDDNRKLGLWFDLLDSGYRVPITGSELKGGSNPELGRERTYVNVDGELTYQTWIEAVRSGKTFISDGPMLTLTVDGELPGSTVDLKGHTVEVTVQMHSQVKIEHMQVLFRREVIGEATVEKVETGYRAIFSEPVALDTPGWIIARCWGKGPDEFFNTGAITSPVYVRVNNQTHVPDRDAVTRLHQYVSSARKTVADYKFKDETQRQRSLSVYDQALQELEKRRSEPET